MVLSLAPFLKEWEIQIRKKFWIVLRPTSSRSSFSLFNKWLKKSSLTIQKFCTVFLYFFSIYYHKSICLLELLVSRKNTRIVHKYSRWWVKKTYFSNESLAGIRKMMESVKTKPILKSVNRPSLGQSAPNLESYLWILLA